MARLLVVLVSVLLLTAGCTTTLPGSDGGTDTPTFTDQEVHSGLAPNVEVLMYALDPVHITVVERGGAGRGVVLNETYTNVTQVEYDEEGTVFRENNDYRIVIRVNGTTRWNETIAHYESYQLRIENNRSVTVVEHSMA